MHLRCHDVNDSPPDELFCCSSSIRSVQTRDASRCDLDDNSIIDENF